MTETNEQFLKQMLKYLPQLGISIKRISDDTGVSSTTLYNIRNGMKVSSAKGQYLLSQLICLYPIELEKTKVLLQIDIEREEKEAANVFLG